MTQTISRQLDAHEIRVIGCLLEKQQATPDYYPLTLNALVAACNQRSNRYPVLTLSEAEVSAALERLLQDGLVAEDETGRATRWSQKVDWKWNLNAPRKAALTVLLLRGAQTIGEVRSRAARMHDFASIDDAEAALADLAAPPEPLAVLLEREPGQKEPRWDHRVGSEQAAAMSSSSAVAPASSTATHRATRAPATTATSAQTGFNADLMLRRIERLEQQVEELKAAVFKKGGLPG